MGDLKDVYMDLYGKRPDPEKPKDKPPTEEDILSGGDDLLPGGADLPVGNLADSLTDQIRKIREMVALDFGMINKEIGEEEVAALDQESGLLTGGKPSTPQIENVTSAPVAEKAPEEAPPKPEKPAMEELEELIGLESIKKDVKELVDLVKTQTMRKQEGLKEVPVSLHLVFSGNPGTGKTTVARILARLYKEIGALSQGQLVECDRSSLVAGFIGQTAMKTQEKIKEAMGGILFIDEAYTLAKEGQDYGQEAIDTLLKAMEDHRGEFVVIVAGYTDLMKKFVESNPGLKSRFNKYIEFPDYSREELLAIFNLQCKKYEYVLSEEAHRLVEERITLLEKTKGENFANAREIRNLFERIITLQATRVAKLEKPDAEALKLIEAADVLSSLEEKKLPEAKEAQGPKELSLAEEMEGEENLEPGS